ncbi:MAG: 4-alpha-glucanotransferase [bacterium]|nr:4-alpha-glucanotransferase [bacterium]
MQARASGILMALTSLPTPHGIGDLGPAARRFADFLARGQQRVWQLLPLGPVGYGFSPYASLSAFAIEPALISLDDLVRDGWLEQADLEGAPSGDPDRVDHAGATAWKRERLERAFARASERDLPGWMTAFFEQAAAWLEEWVLFISIKEDLGDRPWIEWPESFRDRHDHALAHARETLASRLQFHRFVQALAFQQLTELKQHANARGVALFGDVPIYVAHDSADTWGNRHLFWLDGRGYPVAVAGVPPDAFSTTGQRWGNPLYAWSEHHRTGFRWWVDRMAMASTCFDLVRIDHFRGLAACWAIPSHLPDGRGGTWIPSPGDALLGAIESRLGRFGLIAEDLGIITPDVDALRHRHGIPGMKVLQFAFGSDDRNPHLPANVTVDTVMYTGTHDNDTSRGWYEAAPGLDRHRFLNLAGTDGSRPALDLMRLSLESRAWLAVTPLQDLLELGNEARMNLPGTTEGNWQWRLRPEALTDGLAEGLAGFTRSTGRA